MIYIKKEQDFLTIAVYSLNSPVMPKPGRKIGEGATRGRRGAIASVPKLHRFYVNHLPQITSEVEDHVDVLHSCQLRR